MAPEDALEEGRSGNYPAGILGASFRGYFGSSKSSLIRLYGWWVSTVEGRTLLGLLSWPRLSRYHQPLYPSASFPSAVWASYSQEQLSSAKPSPLDFLSHFPLSPEADYSNWNPTKRMRIAPGTRHLQHYTEEEGHYTGRLRISNRSSHAFRVMRWLSS